jgi:hypothetical protein
MDYCPRTWPVSLFNIPKPYSNLLIYRSLKWTCKQLHIGKGIFNKCHANPWNAFVREELNEYNEGTYIYDLQKRTYIDLQ